MDNARSHTAKCKHGQDIYKQNKAGKIKFLKDHGITATMRETVVELDKKIKMCLKTDLKPAVVELIEEAGHKVIFLPPYHPELNAIEKIWAYVKFNVADTYSYSRSFPQLGEKLHSIFSGLEDKISLVQRIISHVEAIYENDYYIKYALEDGGDPTSIPPPFASVPYPLLPNPANDYFDENNEPIDIAQLVIEDDAEARDDEESSDEGEEDMDDEHPQHTRSSRSRSSAAAAAPAPKRRRRSTRSHRPPPSSDSDYADESEDSE